MTEPLITKSKQNKKKAAVCRCSSDTGRVFLFIKTKKKSAEVIVVVDTSGWKERRTHEATKD
jgi:Mg-chelatase subunit ChlD